MSVRSTPRRVGRTGERPRGSRWRVVKSPVAQFLAVGVIAMVAIAVGARVLADRAAKEEALIDARATTEVLARSVAQPSIPRGLSDGDPGALDRFDRLATSRLLVNDVRRIKVWAEDGRIVYSDEVRLIGDVFELGADELEILLEGGSAAEMSDLTEPENRYERGGGGLVEVYTQVWTPEGEPLLFEAYFSVAGIESRQAAVIAPFQRITYGALAVLVLVATTLLWALTRRVTRAAAEREQLLLNAATASARERRRIARDLHDGVVQDLAGSAFAVSAMARHTEEPDRTTLLSTGVSLRRSLRALRSLLVEIHPPDLNETTLPAALEDLCAPATASGVEVTVAVDGLGAVQEQEASLVWRVSQEAVRNTLRHARATSMTVSLRRCRGSLVLVVSDDGIGFEVDAVQTTSHYGLRGLGSLVHDSGGTLVVRSQPGSGTDVRLETTR